MSTKNVDKQPPTGDDSKFTEEDAKETNKTMDALLSGNVPPEKLQLIMDRLQQDMAQRAPPPPGAAADPPFTSTPNQSWMASAQNPGFNPPKLTQFHGDGKQGIKYRQFKQEILNLVDSGYPPHVITQAITRSVKGPAYDALSNLDRPTMDMVIADFDLKFGDPIDKNSLYEIFHSSSQRPGESIMEWSSRIEGLYADMERNNMVLGDRNEALRTKLYKGLYSRELRVNSRHVFDKGEPYSSLVWYLRSLEKELEAEVNHNPINAPKSSTTSTDQSSEVQKLTKSLECLQQQVKQMSMEFRRFTATPNQPQPQHQLNAGINYHAPAPQPNNGGAQQAGQQGRKFCEYCRRNGHMIQECRTRERHMAQQQQAQQQAHVVHCTYCGRNSHTIDQCRTRQRDMWGQGNGQPFV